LAFSDGIVPTDVEEASIMRAGRAKVQAVALQRNDFRNYFMRRGRWRLNTFR
jgi:hypothetical protein